MRTFIAVNLSDEVKDNINRVTEKLKKAESKVKWVKKENLHLTLKFLGEVDEEKIKNIGSALEKKLISCGEFEIKIKGIGTFPRVIWYSVVTGADLLKEIWSSVEEVVESEGFGKDSRGFSAHITIGRIKAQLDQAFKVELENLKDLDCGISKVSAVSIIKSTLTPAGPVYEEIKNISLRRN